jgi:hypothetical protein
VIGCGSLFIPPVTIQGEHLKTFLIFKVDICILFVYKAVMKCMNKQKEKIGAFDVFFFTNSVIKGLYFIYYRRMEIKPTKEHKTIHHVFIIHGMNQKFNRFLSFMSSVILKKMKKIGGTMVKNYRLAIDFTINIDEEIKAQGNFNVRKQFIDNYPLIINYFQSNPEVLREFLKMRFCEFYLDSCKAKEFIKLLKVKNIQEIFIPMLSNLPFYATFCILRLFYTSKMDINEDDIKKTEDELALFLEQFYQIHFTQTSFEEIGEDLDRDQDTNKEMDVINQALEEFNNNEINLNGRE